MRCRGVADCRSCGVFDTMASRSVCEESGPPRPRRCHRRSGAWGALWSGRDCAARPHRDQRRGLRHTRVSIQHSSAAAPRRHAHRESRAPGPSHRRTVPPLVESRNEIQTAEGRSSGGVCFWEAGMCRSTLRSTRIISDVIVSVTVCSRSPEYTAVYCIRVFKVPKRYKTSGRGAAGGPSD